MARIALVDDDQNILTSVAIALESEGHTVKTYEDGAEALEAITASPPDLVISDIKMPRMDGMELLRRLRQNSQLPLIFLTSKDEEIDEVLGLTLGADDYVKKPFSQRLLLERVKAVLRRAERSAQMEDGEQPADARLARFGRFTLNLDSHKLFDGEGSEVPLTGMEFDLLKAFADNPNRVLSRDQLLNLAHNRDWEPFDRSIDIRIARIRRKIEGDPAKPQVIKTVRGAGYIYSTAKS